MKKNIDPLNNVTGWILNLPSEIFLNEYKDFIAGLNDKSLMIKFSKNDVIKKAIKVFPEPIDISEYETLIFSIWSQSKKNYDFKSSSDFSYKIKINDENEFYLPIYQTFTDINIGIEEINEISRIEITALHDIDDFIIISEMIVEKEELDYDVISAVKEHIEYYLNKDLGDGILIGSGSGKVGDSYLTIPNSPKFLAKYAVIKISDQVNSEVHQLDDTDGLTYQINDNYDGNKILHDYTNANITLLFPVYLNPGQLEIRLPGIAIWGIDPEPILRGNKLDLKIDTFKVESDNFKGIIDGQLWKYSVLIDIEARGNELLTTMANIVRKFIAKEVLWINGRYHEIYFTSKPLEQKAIEGVDILPKIQYGLTVETKQNIYNRSVFPKTTAVNINVNIKEN